jgi:Tfp pilus assembly protein PilX
MGSSRGGGPASCQLRSMRKDRRGFALVLVLIVLAALYLGATGIFLAARAELRIGISHAASSQAFFLAEAGLATWLASAVQPSEVKYEIGGDTVTVRATVLLRVDSATVAYHVVAQATVGAVNSPDPGLATRQTSVLGLRTDQGPVRPVRRTWREIF